MIIKTTTMTKKPTAKETNSPAALKVAFEGANAWIEGLDRQPVNAVATYETLMNRLDVGLQDQGLAADRVIADLIAATEGGHLASAGGRFFAWVIGGGLESALAADWLASTWDQNAALYSCGPAAAVTEEIVGEWLKELLDLPRESSFAFTTGCQLAHFTSLAAARYAILKDRGWDVNAEGLFNAPEIRLMTSDQKHGSVDRAARFLGIGTKQIAQVATQADGTIDPADFERVLNSNKLPTIVVLNAGDLNIGAFDDFEKLIPIAKASGAWVHIDGAFGLFARASRAKQGLTKGIELADSWATDGHKWLNVPFDCGIAIVRDTVAHSSAMTLSASYISAATEVRNQIDWNPEWSRRARGFSVYAALRELGRDGVESLIDRCCDYCHQLVMGIAALPGAKLIFEPTLNQGLVSFVDPRIGATDDDHDRWTEEMMQRINASGEAFFSGTTWRGRRAMRVSVVNWRTSQQDVAHTLATISALLQKVIV